MKKFKTILSSILYILLFLCINFGSIIVFSLIFRLTTNLDINSQDYVTFLAQFLSKNKIYIVLLSTLILIPIILKTFKKNKININLYLKKECINYSIMGFSISLILNILLYDLGLQRNTGFKIEPIMGILATAVVGPILEELVFRGIIYNNLKKSFSIKSSLLILSLMFAVYHFNFVQGLYAFLFSIIITYYYEKTDNFLVPTFIHIVGNLAISLVYPYLLQLDFIYIQLVLILLIVVNIISVILLNKKNNYLQ